jgi:hypothetical protein
MKSSGIPRAAARTSFAEWLRKEGRTNSGCILSRLILLTAGKEPKPAELFARAELKRGSCAASAPSTTHADWVTGAENPRLGGTI